MCCPTCGDILQARTYDYGRCSETGYHDAGEYLYCDICRQSVDEGDALEDGPEAERLRERREAEIESAQYSAWLAGKAVTGDAVESAGGGE